jgi:hypothetical protein
MERLRTNRKQFLLARRKSHTESVVCPVLKPELIDERDRYLAPVDRWEETAKWLKASWFAPGHYLATTFLPYAATLISVFSLGVAFAAFWTRPNSHEKSAAASEVPAAGSSEPSAVISPTSTPAGS